METKILFFTLLSVLSSSIKANDVTIQPYNLNTTTVTHEVKDSKISISFDGEQDKLPNSVRKTFPSVVELREESNEETKIISNTKSAKVLFESIFIGYKKYQKVEGKYHQVSIPKNNEIKGIKLAGEVLENGQYSNVVVHSPQNNKQLEQSLKGTMESVYAAESIHNRTFRQGEPIPFERSINLPLHPDLKAAMSVKGTYELVRLTDRVAYIETVASGSFSMNVEGQEVTANTTIKGKSEYNLQNALVVLEARSNVLTMSIPAYEGYIHSVSTVNTRVSRTLH